MSNAEQDWFSSADDDVLSTYADEAVAARSVGSVAPDINEFLDARGVAHPELRHRIDADDLMTPAYVPCDPPSRPAVKTWVDVHGNRHVFWYCE